MSRDKQPSAFICGLLAFAVLLVFGAVLLVPIADCPRCVGDGTVYFNVKWDSLKYPISHLEYVRLEASRSAFPRTTHSESCGPCSGKGDVAIYRTLLIKDLSDISPELIK